MINKLSKAIANKLIKSGTINSEDYDIYVYGLFMLISQLIFLILILLLGAIFNCIIESILFYISFFAIRRYAGGYHAKTETKCEILSALSLLISISSIHFLELSHYSMQIYLISIVSSLCIFTLAPLDTSQKPLSHSEYKYFRKKALSVIIFVLIINALSVYLKADRISIPLGISIILESFLLLIGTLKKKHVRNQLLNE